MNRVANIFELLSDENDDGGARRPTAVANVDTGSARKPEQKQQKPAANAQAKQQKPSDRPAETKGRENRPPKSNERKEDRRPRQERGEGAPQQQGQVTERKPREANRPPRQQRENAERRNKNAERAAENLEGGERKRVFDRKSGTGRGIRDNTKRSGGGKGNWGTVEDDKKAQLEQTETPEVVKEETTETTEAKPAEAEKTEAVEPEVSKEDEEDAKLKTLAEYMQSRKAPAIALPPPRQVESKPEWDKYVPLTRASEDQPKEKKKEDKEVAESDAQKKTVSADQFFNFADTSPRGGFRGGRGGRGRESRRGDRGSKKPKAPTPNFKDEKSFPSLGNKA